MWQTFWPSKHSRLLHLPTKELDALLQADKMGTRFPITFCQELNAQCTESCNVEALYCAASTSCIT